MKVEGEPFSFIILKNTVGAIPECQENPYREYINELFPNNSRRISQVKEQSKKVI